MHVILPMSPLGPAGPGRPTCKRSGIVSASTCLVLGAKIRGEGPHST